MHVFRQDEKLRRLRRLTGGRRHADLTTLARLGDLVDVPTGSSALHDWVGAGHAVAVLAGCCRTPDGAVHDRGDVFVTRRYDRVEATAATVVVADARHADTLRTLLRRLLTPGQPAPDLEKAAVRAASARAG